MEMTKEQLLADFREWSGGFLPEECDEREVQTYVRTNVAAEDRDEAMELLTSK